MPDGSEDLRNKVARFLPMPGRIVVEPIEETRYGGLLLPASSQARSSIGRVIAVGMEPGATVEDANGYLPAVGDVILFSQNAGSAVDVGYGRGRAKAIFLKANEVISRVVWEAEPEPPAAEVRDA